MTQKTLSTHGRWLALATALLLSVGGAAADSNQLWLEAWRDHSNRLEAEQAEREQALWEAEAQAQAAHEQSLRRRLQACGQCNERAALEAEISQIERNREIAFSILCKSFEAMDRMSSGVSFADGPVVRLARLLGYEAACNARYAPARQAAKDEAYRRQLAEALRGIEAGAPLAYLRLSLLVSNGETSTPLADRRRAACTLYLAGAKQGRIEALSQLLGDCMDRQASPQARQQAYELTLACADRGEQKCVAALGGFAQGLARVSECSRQGFAPCTAALSAYHDPARSPETVPAGFTPDPAERLRLLELAVAQGMPNLENELRRLRLASGTLHIGVRPGRYLLSGRIDRQGRAGSSGNYRGDCEISAAGERQYRFECRLGGRVRVSTGVVQGEHLRMSVDGFELEFLLREDKEAGGQATLLRARSSDGQLSESYMVHFAAALGQAGAPGAPSGSGAAMLPPPTRSASPAERQCAAAQRLTERYRALAQRDPRFAPQAERLAIEQKSKCGSVQP